MEAITDPLPPGSSGCYSWCDAQSNEIGDKCSGAITNLQTDGSGKQYNVAVGTSNFVLPAIWVSNMNISVNMVLNLSFLGSHFASLLHGQHYKLHCRWLNVHCASYLGLQWIEFITLRLWSYCKYLSLEIILNLRFHSNMCCNFIIRWLQVANR